MRSSSGAWRFSPSAVELARSAASKGRRQSATHAASPTTSATSPPGASHVAPGREALARLDSRPQAAPLGNRNTLPPRLLAPNYPAWQEATVGRLNGGAGSASSTVSHVGPPGGDGLRLFDEQADEVVAPPDAAARPWEHVAVLGGTPASLVIAEVNRPPGSNPLAPFGSGGAVREPPVRDVVSRTHGDPDRATSHHDALGAVADGDRRDDAVRCRVDARDGAVSAGADPHGAQRRRRPNRARGDGDGLCWRFRVPLIGLPSATPEGRRVACPPRDSLPWRGFGRRS